MKAIKAFCIKNLEKHYPRFHLLELLFYQLIRGIQIILNYPLPNFNMGKHNQFFLFGGSVLRFSHNEFNNQFERSFLKESTYYT